MKINYKLLLWIITTAISITIIGNLIFGFSFRSFLKEQESAQTLANAKNININLTSMMVKYKAVAEDWGYWDETYDFIAGDAPDYISLNLSPDSLHNINVNIMAFYNMSKTNVYKVNIDLETGVFIDFPDTLSQKIEAILDEGPGGSAEDVTRMIKDGDDYYVLSMVRTTDSVREKPDNGYLVVGRKIDPAAIDSLTQITNSQIRFLPREEAKQKTLGTRSIALGTDGSFYSTIINEKLKKMTAYVLPANLDDSNPSIAVEMVCARVIFSKGLDNLYFIEWAYTGWILLVVLILFWLLRITITNPIYKLSHFLNHINTEKSQFDRLPVNEKNELAGINKAINNIFSKIENQQEYMKKSETRLLSAQEMARVGNWELDLDSLMLWASVETFNIFGIEPGSQVIPEELLEEQILPEYREGHRRALFDLINDNKEYDEIYKITHKITGEERYIRSKAVRIQDDDKRAVKIAGALQDITDYKRTEQEILYISNHDQLTGIYSRRFYENELRNLDNKENLPLTIAMGDINGLKLINDSFGHTMGDELITKAASVIARGCRPGDIVARLGGDEIVIVMPKTDAAEAEALISQITESASRETVGSVNLSISFGHETKYTIEQDMKDILRNTENHMYRNKLYESSSARSRAIDLIVNALYEKSTREMVHSMRVSQLCEMIAKSMDFSNDEVNQIRIAGLMHDIGKIGIDETILNKPGKLTKEEMKEIDKHSEVGYRILSSANEFSEIANFVLEHHERWDGKGYPRKLQGEQISLQARIIAIADGYDAMTSVRPYQDQMSEEAAMREIRKSAGTQFDPVIARVFIEKVLGQQWT